MSRRKAYLISNGLFDIKSNNRGNKSWYFSEKNNARFYADSDIEHLRMEQLDNSEIVLNWTKRHGIRIPYQFDGVRRNCVPDFLVEFRGGKMVIEEVKGRITPLELCKKDAIERYCKDCGFGFSFLTQSEVKKIGRVTD
jgi:hypothetical protein